MDFLTPLFGTAENFLALLVAKEGNKWREDYEKIKNLRLEYSNEMLKRDEDQSDLRLVTIKRELLIICQTLEQYKPNPPNK
jgi:hypothetical protein